MEKTVDLSDFVQLKKSEFSIKTMKDLAAKHHDALKAFIEFGKFTDFNGITYQVASKELIDGVIECVADAYTASNQIVKHFDIPADDFIEFVEDELFDDETNEYSEMSVVATKDGKVIGFISCDDEFDLDDEDEEEEDENEPPYENPNLEKFAAFEEEIGDVMEEGMDLVANKELEHAYITHLAVLPEFQRKNIASTLFKLCVGISIHIGYKKLMAYTFSRLANDLVEELGFMKMCKGERVSEFENEEGEVIFENIDEKEDFVVCYYGISLE